MKDKEKYEIAVDAWNEYIRDMNAPPSYVDWLRAKLTPEPQEWECIKEFPAKWGLVFTFGNKYQPVFDGVDFNDFPNHFKKVEPAQQEPAPKAEGYTMQDEITNYLKSSRQTETRYREVLERVLLLDCRASSYEKAWSLTIGMIKKALGK